MLTALITTAALTATGGVANYATRTRKVARTNFDKVITATTPMYDAALSPISDAGIKEFRIPIRDAKVEIANGVKYQGRTFGGTVPGPVIHVRQGDLVRITVVNDAGMPHSIVFRGDASGEGIYPFVTHAVADAEKGAVGMIQMGVPKQFATLSH